jgi:hypothetical protein
MNFFTSKHPPNYLKLWMITLSIYIINTLFKNTPIYLIFSNNFEKIPINLLALPFYSFILTIFGYPLYETVDF